MTEADGGFVVVIPARRASTRLPDKALADLAGKPMVVRVAERAHLSSAVRVIVAYDDEAIGLAVRAHGHEAFATAATHASGTDRIAEVASVLLSRGEISPQTLIVNVQGDEPMIEPALIDATAAALAAAGDCAMSTACHALADDADLANPNVVKVVRDARGHALYFSRAPIPWRRDPDAAVDDAMRPMRHVGIYAYRAGFLPVFSQLAPAPIERIEALEQLRALWHGHRIVVFESTNPSAAGVDTAADLARVRALFTGPIAGT